MARPRTPTNVLELRGAFKRNPQRRADRADEPQPKGDVGAPPEWLAADAVRAWHDIVAVAPGGVLGDTDRIYLEVASELLALKRRVGVEAIDPAKLNRLETMLGKLGMNPADRSKVKAPGSGKPKNEFEQF